jgi:hypothetical protein
MWNAVEAMAFSFGYAWSGEDRGRNLPERFASGHVIDFNYVYPGKITYSQSRELVPSREAIDPADTTLAVICERIGWSALPVIQVGKHTVKFVPAEKRLEIGCLQVSFAEVHKIHDLVASNKREPVHIECANEVVFRGVESILLMEGFRWIDYGNGRLERVPSGKACINLYTRPGANIITFSVSGESGVCVNAVTECDRMMSYISAYNGAVTIGGRTVKIDREKCRAISVSDDEEISFDQINSIHEAVETLEK